MKTLFIAAVLGLLAGTAYAQTQYGDPGRFPGAASGWASSPPNPNGSWGRNQPGINHAIGAPTTMPFAAGTGLGARGGLPNSSMSGMTMPGMGPLPGGTVQGGYTSQNSNQPLQMLNQFKY